MLTPSDLIFLNYTPDLTQAGIAYACRLLTRSYNPGEGSNYDWLRHIVAEVVVELAFRRFLVADEIPHESLGARPFTDPDRHKVYLGGRICEIKSHLITQRDSIRSLRNDPEYLLQASAQVPSDQLRSGNLSDKDIYIFAFVTALITPTKDELERAISADQPTYYIHLLPEIWARPAPWISLRQLVLKADTTGPITLELGGQGETHEFISELIQLLPRQRTCAQADFYSLTYLHTSQIPDARVGIHSPTTKKTHIVASKDWSNIWVYGMDIIMAGFMTHGEFRRKARPVPSSRQVRQPSKTSSRNMAITISSLRTMKDLFNSVEKWSAQYKTNHKP